MNSDLINRYLDGDCTPAEEEVVEKWLKDKNNALLSDKWLTEREDRSNIINEAIAGKDDVWKVIKANFFNNSLKKISFQSFFRYGYSVAAMLGAIILLVLAGWLYERNLKNIIISSGYGEIVKILLPDSSVVYLNGNSGISYEPDWKGEVREVWLKGEAFFQVKHLKNNKEFLVHLNNKEEIEVLGTEFDVSYRKGKSRLVLKSGKIKILLAQKSMIMSPGYLVEIDSLDHVTSKVVNTEMYSFWTTGKWKLEDTSLKEILGRIEDVYGKKVGVYDQNILFNQASGTLPLPRNNDVGILLSDIAIIFDSRVTMGKDSLYMISKL